ncbi:MAG: RNA polymerase factor sigma-54 [Myxococcales bacterium FL481]|nr:MAG: RNA polymerase factor sigma-54 [Myxococcales bacterium FL481]
MALYMRQELRMSQQLVMTPQLQQAIKLLQLSRMELLDHVRGQLLENPLLEEGQEMNGAAEEEPVSSVELQDGVETQGAEDGFANATATETAQAQEVSADAPNADNFDWEGYLQQQSHSAPLPQSGIRADDDFSPEQNLTRPETLVDHLLWQIRLSSASETERSLADYLARTLTAGGYMRGPSVMQVARRNGCSTLRAELALRRVQQLDPLAIGSRSLAEALWIQARHPEHPIDDPLVLAIISKHLPNLSNKAYSKISKDTGETTEEVYEATKVVLALEPRPARAFVSEDPQYITPDVFVYKIGGEYVVTLNDDGLPRLKISGVYRHALEGGGQTKEYVTERLRSAQWLIRSIQQRQRTILKVTRSILKFQREFFERGPQYLRPLILKDVAEDIEMHESTVSRVTTNKYVHTPQGLFELKYFFNAGISRGNGEELASEAVKTKIKKFIDSEDQRHPYSDQKLVELLRKEGISIARRTVAKYREQLNVLSSSKRRKLF